MAREQRVEKGFSVMIVFNMPQYSPEYWAVKCGIPSASNFRRILTASREQLAAGRKSYINELIADRRNPSAPFTTERAGHTQAMRNGANCEPDARRFFAAECDVQVEQVGFCLTDDGRFGCSPDGLVGEDSGLELKCPEGDTHVGYCLDGELPPQYKAQIHGCMIVTGRPTWWFMSYCPGFEKQLLIKVERDSFTEKLDDALAEFWQEYNEASRKMLGLPAPHVDVKAYQATVAAFDAWLAKVTTEAELNAGLENLSGLQHHAKRAAWDQILAFARLKGWEFDRERKRFYKPAHAEPVF